MKTDLILKYDGYDVEKGTIDIDSLVSALQGFNKAYNAISKEIHEGEKHTITIKGFNKGSFNTFIETIVEHDRILGIIASVATILSFIIILKKKDAKEIKKIDKNNNAHIEGDNNSVIQIQIPQECGDNNEEFMSIINKLLKDKNLNQGLSSLVTPLEKDRIDSVSLHSITNNIEENININVQDKHHFMMKDTSIITTEDAILTVDSITSLNKKTNNGKMLIKEALYPIKLCMENAEEYYKFFSYKGEMSIKCNINYNTDNINDIILIEVYDIYPIHTS